MIQFKDGAAYERYMGKWSRLAGQAFLDWLAPGPGLRWLDVGCGSGAFTELLVERCAPAAVDGVDPSEAQLAFARERPALRDAVFRQGDAMAIPYADAAFDAAVMPLVIFFVPDPAKGVAEMARVVGAGGIVSSYSWDIPGGGFPYMPLQEEMRIMGIAVPMPPRPDAARIDVLQELWTAAGLDAVETQAITVQRTYANLDEYWEVVLGAPSVGSQLKALGPEDASRLRTRLQVRLPATPDGRIIVSARANAIQGRVRTDSL